MILRDIVTDQQPIRNSVFKKSVIVLLVFELRDSKKFSDSLVEKSFTFILTDGLDSQVEIFFLERTTINTKV